MNWKRLIVLGIAWGPATAYAAPAALSIATPGVMRSSQSAASIVTVDVGTAGVFGAADFTLTFDTHVVTLNALAPLAAELGENFFFNPDALSQGKVRIVTFNGESSSSPGGAVALSSMTLQAVGVGGSSTTINAQIHLLVDTQTISYFPVGVVPGSITVPSTTPDEDTVPPVSQLVFSTAPYVNPYNTRFISTSTYVRLAAEDSAPGASGVAFSEYVLHPSTRSSFTRYSSTFTLSAGSHRIDYRSRDIVGNIEAAQSSGFWVDALPPVSQLEFAWTPLPDGTPMISTATPIRVRSTDPRVNNAASGIKESWVKIDNGSFTLTTGSFFITSPSSSPHTITYYSRDNVLNQEVVHSTTVFVHFSSSVAGSTLSAALTTPSPAGAGMAADFYLRKTFVFPNPSRGGAVPTVHIEVGQADQVTIRIYDAAGRQLKDVTLTHAPALIDSGAGPELAYEYAWDDAIPSGVYFYLIEAKKAEAAVIHDKGKFAVIK